MIQNIAPHVYHSEFITGSVPKPDDYALHYEYNKIMLYKHMPRDPYTVPTFELMEKEDPDVYKKAYYLFSIDDHAYYLLRDIKVPEFGGYVMEGLQIMRGYEPDYQAFAVITGSQIYRWLEANRFCGMCGKPNVYSDKERALVCSSCGQTIYPKICPAIIVAIIDGDRILLTRYVDSRSDHYALVAGYMEIGETPEDTLRREVMEEVGLKVKDIKPYLAQPWSYSDSLMLAYTAHLDGPDVITLQEDELMMAQWFNRSDVPDPKYTQSVGHEMMMKFKNGTL